MRNQCFEIITIFWHWSKIASTYVGLICPCHSDGFLWSITFIHMLININHLWHYTMMHFFRKTIWWLTGNKWKFWKRDYFFVINRIYKQLFWKPVLNLFTLFKHKWNIVFWDEYNIMFTKMGKTAWSIQRKNICDTHPKILSSKP